MTGLLFQLAGGTLFLALAAATAVLIAAGFLFRGGGPVRLLQGMLPFAVIGILLTAPPLPRGALALWTVLAAIWWAETEFRSRRGLRITGPFGVLLAAATLFLAALEIPYVRMPELPAPEGRSVHVVGDSLSAGIGNENRTWPDLLGEKTGLAVTNLASPGARLADGPGQVRGVGAEPSLVLILLGGNDLLMRASRDNYERELRELLDAVSGTGHTVVLFELPVIPGFRHYGRIQRTVAREYGIRQIPSRVLARVLSTEDGTLDGIHLSDRGHRDLAERVAALLP